MAQKVQVLLVDDLDGDQAAGTVSFALDGSAYEIDLSSANATRLREVLAPFVTAARKAPAKRTTARTAKSASRRQQTAEIRAWARAQGKELNDRGRIPQRIIDDYHAARG